MGIVTGASREFADVGEREPDESIVSTRHRLAHLLADGFLEGHLVNVVGWEPATWRLFEIEDDGTLRLRGDGIFVLPTEEGDDPAYVQLASTVDPATFYVQGRHGGLTLVHGGGNRPIRLVDEVAATGVIALTAAVQVVPRLWSSRRSGRN